MDKDTQRLISTIIGIGLLVALILYLKKFIGAGGAFGFGTGKGNTGQGDGASGYGPRDTGPDYSPSNKVVPDNKKVTVAELLHKAAQKLAISNGGGASKPGDFSAMLFDADNACKKQMNSQAKDKDLTIGWNLYQFEPDNMDDVTFANSVTAWLKKAHYKSIKDTAIFKTRAINYEIADFINRALNNAHIK